MELIDGPDSQHFTKDIKKLGKNNPNIKEEIVNGTNHFKNWYRDKDSSSLPPDGTYGIWIGDERGYKYRANRANQSSRDGWRLYGLPREPYFHKLRIHPKPGNKKKVDGLEKTDKLEKAVKAIPKSKNPHI